MVAMPVTQGKVLYKYIKIFRLGYRQKGDGARENHGKHVSYKMVHANCAISAVGQTISFYHEVQSRRQ